MTPAPSQHVLLGGYPRASQEVDRSAGRIGAGPYSAMLPITSVGDGYVMCQIEPKDLISYDGSPLPPADADLGGLSGGPVLLVRTVDYPLVGLIVEQQSMFNDLHLLRIATFEGLDLPNLVP